MDSSSTPRLAGIRSSTSQMKITATLLILYLCGCTTVTLTPLKEKIVKSALASMEIKASETFVFNESGMEIGVRHEPTPPPPDTTPITMNTRYAAACPYCTKVSVSKACLMSGGSGTNQNWTIYFECPSCHMSFSDYRTQEIPPVQSVRLPIVQ